MVGDIPDALPDPAIPDVGADDLVALVAPALGVLVLSAEAVGVARALAVKHGYRVDPNRDLVAMGASNALAGLLVGLRAVRRREPDRGRRRRRRPQPARVARGRRA